MSDNRAKVAGVDELLWPLTQVSTDPSNLTKFDADGNILTSSTDVATAVGAGFVKKAGDTVTGDMVFQGASNTFAQGSINSIAMGPLVLLTQSTATATLNRTDAGKVLVAAPPVNNDFTLTLPAAGAAGITTGVIVEVVSNISSVGKYLFIQAPAGVSLFYNSTLGGSGDGTLGGGVAAKCRLRGPLTSARLVAVNGTTWWAFGDLVTA
jgi:hypothetical protein